MRTQISKAIHDYWAFAASVLTVVIGLLLRSCTHGAGPLTIEMCSGNLATLPATGSPAVHCAGCVMAIIGAVWLVVELALRSSRASRAAA